MDRIDEQMDQRRPIFLSERQLVRVCQGRPEPMHCGEPACFWQWSLDRPTSQRANPFEQVGRIGRLFNGQASPLHLIEQSAFDGPVATRGGFQKRHQRCPPLQFGIPGGTEDRRQSVNEAVEDSAARRCHRRREKDSRLEVISAVDPIVNNRRRWCDHSRRGGSMSDDRRLLGDAHHHRAEAFANLSNIDHWHCDHQPVAVTVETGEEWFPLRRCKVQEFEAKGDQFAKDVHVRIGLIDEVLLSQDAANRMPARRPNAIPPPDLLGSQTTIANREVDRAIDGRVKERRPEYFAQAGINSNSVHGSVGERSSSGGVKSWNSWSRFTHQQRSWLARGRNVPQSRLRRMARRALAAGRPWLQVRRLQAELETP